MSLDSMLEQFKDFEELKEYSKAQFQTIIELSKKVQKLEEERNHLTSLIGDSVPMLEEQRTALLGFNGDETNEEIIAGIQLNKLKDLSYDRELTLDETKRVDIFAKIIINCKAERRNNKKVIEVDSKAFASEDLLKLLDNK